jgi:hypothetical protein
VSTGGDRLDDVWRNSISTNFSVDDLGDVNRRANDIVLCTAGPSRLSGAAMQQLQRKHFAVISGRIERFSIVDRRLNEVVFRNGERLKRDALFFDTRSRLQSTLMAQLGCTLDRQVAFDAGSTKPPLYPAYSLPETCSAMCSCRLSPPPKERAQPSVSTAPSPARTSTAEGARQPTRR